MTSRIMELRSMYNQKSTHMTKEEVQEFLEKLFDWTEKRENADKYADDLISSLIESQKVKIDELKDQLSTIKYSQKSISYDEAIKVVANTYEMSVDDYEHIWAKGNDYLG